MYTVICTPLYVHCYMYTVICTLKCTPLYVHHYMYTVICTPLYVHCYMYTVICTLLYIHRYMYTIILHRYMYTIICTPLYVHCYMYTVICTPLYVHRYMHAVICTPLYVHSCMYTVIFYKGFYILSMPHVKLYMSNHITGLVSPRPGLEGGEEHLLPLTGVTTPNRRTLVSRYSDYAVPAHTVKENTGWLCVRHLTLKAWIISLLKNYSSGGRYEMWR